MNPKYDWLWTFLITFGLIACLFPEIVFSPNSGILQKELNHYEEDALKNYYTFLYHISYDPNILLFKGMNYPFSEHIVFTDNTPLLAMFCWTLRYLGVPISNYGLFFFHYALIFSACTAAAALVKILSRFNLPRLFIILWSIALVLLSPQNNRLIAHYSLAYSVVIPVFLLFLFRFEDKPNSWARLLVLTIWITLTSMIHLYFLAIQAMFLVIYALFRTLFGNATILNSVRLIVLGVIVPFGLILFWTKLVANVPDRPENPYGFLAYRALWEGFFLHPNTFLHQLIEKLGIQIRPIDDFETIGYCGIAASLATLILIFRGIFLLQVKKWFSALNNLPDNVKALRIMLLAAFVLGLFAHGIPFIIPGLDFLMDYLGPLKQFRSIARFMWVYYWVINIFFAIETYRWLSAKNIKQPILSVILVIIGFIPIIEARSSIFIPVYQPIIKYDLTDKQRDFAHYYLSNSKKYPTLIVPLPGIQAGCEWIGREINLPIAVQTLMLSLRTGVPTTAAQLSRTSQRQCIEQFQTGQELTYPATIFNNLPDSASVWMVTPQKINPYNEPGWNFLTLHSNTIYSDTGVKILEIKNFKQHYLEAHKLQQRKLSDKYTFLQKNASLIRGESLPIKSQNNFLYEGTPTVQDTATNWIFSFWMELPKRAVTGFMINIESKQFNQKHLQQHNISSYMQYIQEGWALFEVPIQYKASNPLKISYIYNKQPIEFHFKWASLRPHQYSFIENKDGVRLFNGRQILVND
ncbi:MAG: hypothetical protein LC115_00655 [Bacteroidia bacterium]|nr:hypothetical protein [Bacteroidia bacterium]